MIGLLDCEIFKTRERVHLPRPNLEIMKLGAYYKNELKEPCQILTSFEEIDLYEKVILRADDIASVPRDALWKPQVEFGGLAFTEGSYKPLQPDLIEFMLPTPRVYQRYLEQRREAGVKSEEITSFLENSYYRMYAGKNKLPLPRVIKRKRIYVYDKNIFGADWDDILKDLSARGPSGIFMVYPIHCPSIDMFLNARKVSKISRQNQFILDFYLAPKDLISFFSQYKNKLLAEITKESHVYLYLGKNHQINFYDRFFFDKNIIYIMNILFSFWSRGIPIKLLQYKHQGITIVHPYDKLYAEIVSWANNGNDKTFCDRKISKESRKQLNTFLDRNPDHTELFHHNIKELISNGIWQYH